MDDSKIVELYWQRDESAIEATAHKYGRYCHYIAYQILQDEEDSRECVNDTYLKAWNAMPPHRPTRLAAFLGRITRNLSLNTYKYYSAKKRGGGQMELALEELQQCIPGGKQPDQSVEEKELLAEINAFLKDLPVEARKIFVRRYWYLSSVKEIASDYAIGESKVKMSLLRSRNALRERLEQKGFAI